MFSFFKNILKKQPVENIPLPDVTGKKIAILYIALGRYDVFWKEFYETANQYFLPNVEKTFFVFTDSTNIQETSDIIKIPTQKMGWPYDTMKRFELFLTQEDKLKEYDYIFFFNANMKFKNIVEAEILPTDYHEGLAMGLHPGYYNKKNNKFPYERNPQSTSYIPLNEGKYYVQGCLNGGTSKEYLKLCHWCNEQLDKDLSNNIIPVWHDESILNKYVLDKKPLIIPCNYLYPEKYNLPKFKKNIKIIQISKKDPKYGGIAYLRGETDEKLSK